MSRSFLRGEDLRLATWNCRFHPLKCQCDRALSFAAEDQPVRWAAPPTSNPSNLARLNTGTTTPRIPVRPSNSGTRLGTGTIFSLFTASPEISCTRNAKRSPPSGDRKHRFQRRDPLRQGDGKRLVKETAHLCDLAFELRSRSYSCRSLCIPATLCGTSPPEHARLNPPP